MAFYTNCTPEWSQGHKALAQSGVDSGNWSGSQLQGDLQKFIYEKFAETLAAVFMKRVSYYDVLRYGHTMH